MKRAALFLAAVVKFLAAVVVGIVFITLIGALA